VGAGALQRAITEPERVARLFIRGLGEPTFLPDGEPFVLDGRPGLWRGCLPSCCDSSHRCAGALRRAGDHRTAYFGQAERAAARFAEEIAGLEVLRIVNKPTAVAVVHGLGNPGEPGRTLVFDLGGRNSLTLCDGRVTSS
jgi:hypothetical protein